MGKEDVGEEHSQQREQQCEFLVRSGCARGHCGCWLRRGPEGGPGRPGKGLGLYLKCKQKLQRVLSRAVVWPLLYFTEPGSQCGDCPFGPGGDGGACEVAWMGRGERRQCQGLV